jgi:tetratricopeptide (TPR) repeat protein
MPSPEFTNSIVAGLEYWRERTRDLDDRVIAQIDGRRQNLFRAVHFGLELEATWPAVAEVALQTVPLVNRRMYRAEWIPVLEGLLAHCPAGDRSLKFDLLIQLGRMQRLERHLEQATRTHQAAEALARELEDEAALAKAYYNLGRGYYDRHQHEEAERNCQAALDILDGLENADQSLVAWALDTIGNASSARGDFEKAKDYLARNVAIRRTLNDPTGLARALIDQSRNLLLYDHLDEAIACLIEAEDLLTLTANELDKTLVGINLGSIYFRQGEWLLAEEAFRQAYSPYLRRSGNLHYQAHLATNLGNALFKQERFVEAEAYMRQGVALWRKMNDDISLANAIGSLGEILAAQGDSEAALPLFDEALGLLEQFSEHSRAKGLRELFEGERKKAEEGLNK